MQVTVPITATLLDTLDDGNTGSHRAYIHKTTISWTVDGKLIRSFRSDSPISRSSETHARDSERVVFSRFKEVSTSADAVVCLCIFRPGMLAMHYQSGETFWMSIPFPVRSIHALRIGLLIQRMSTEDLDDDHSLFTASMPTLFSLLSPRGELNLLGLSKTGNLDHFQRQRSGQFLLSPVAPQTIEDVPATSYLPIFNSPNYVLVGAEYGRRSSQQNSQFILCWDTEAKRHLIYQCHLLEQSSDTGMFSSAADHNDNTPYPAAGAFNIQSTTATESESEAASEMGEAVLEGGRGGRGSIVARPMSTRQQSSLSVHRRSSAAAMAATSRRKSSFSTAIKANRRSSLLGRISFNDSPGPVYAADLFDEHRQMRAEVVLYLCWKERRHRTGANSKVDPLDVQMCIIQSPTGEDIICLLDCCFEQVVGIDTKKFTEVFRYDAKSMAPVPALRDDMDDLLLITASGHPAIVIDASGSEPIPVATAYSGKLAKIQYVEDKRANVALADNKDSSVTIATQLRLSKLAISILNSLSLVLCSKTYLSFRRSLVSSLSQACNIQNEMERLTSLFIGDNDDQKFETYVIEEMQNRSEAVMYALSLVYEDATLCLCTQKSSERLASFKHLLVRLAAIYNLPNTQQAYILDQSFFSDWATSSDVTSLRPLQGLSSIQEVFGINDSMGIPGAASILGGLDVVANIFYHLRKDGLTPAILQTLSQTKTSPLMLFLQLNPELQWIIRNIISQLRIQCCPSLSDTTGPLPTWPANTYTLLGRHDLAFISEHNHSVDSQLPSAMSSSTPHSLLMDDSEIEDPDMSAPIEPRSIVEICEQALDPLSSTSSLKGTQKESRSEFSQMAFSRDLRVEEADELLDISATVHTRTQLHGADSSESIGERKQQFLGHLACRVMAVSPGRAMFKYSSRSINWHDSLPISSPKVEARFQGQKSATKWAPGGDVDISWPLFHAGVMAALSIERNQLQHAHPSWVLLNWPGEMSSGSDPAAAPNDEALAAYKNALSSHAGFLLGMGLLNEEGSGMEKSDRHSRSQKRGPLSTIPPWQSFKYLTIRHGLTSIALLLGCACAQRGTMDRSISKILSLHIPNLLSPGSSELMLLSYGTQAAAMFGLGLLFMGSQNRRMVEVMLRELGSIRRHAQPNRNSGRISDVDPAESTAECYSLATGFSLGLTVLGKGQSTRSLADLHLLDSVSGVVSGSAFLSSARNHSNQRARGLSSNVGSLGGDPAYAEDNDHQNESGTGVSDLGAIAAIGLMFLGTNYQPATQRLVLPNSLHQLRRADPFQLLWKTLMQSLIMLDLVVSTRDWIEGNIPCELLPNTERNTLDTEELPSSLPPDLCRIRLNIVAAGCFAVALKYAGTEDQSAHSVILGYFEELESILNRPALGYEASLTRVCAQSCLDVVCVSLALVMAGSGDIATMKRLRTLHGASAARTYGNHMASHMALGLLFLGGGARFTISRSLDSIALLVISLFPRFPQHYTDNAEHLQAWRHLWSLCVVSRCLVVRDVVTNRLCKNVTTTITYNDGTTKALGPLAAFPSLEGATHVQLQSPEYLPLDVNLTGVTNHACDLITKRRILYMQPANHQSKLVSNGLLSLTTYPQYMTWLSETQRHITDIVSNLTEKMSLASSAIRAVRRLRVCAEYSQYIDSGKMDSKVEGWLENTYMAWVSVRQAIVELGKQPEVRDILAKYWSANSDVPDPQKELLQSVVGLLHAALSIPSPSNALALAKTIPMETLIDYFVR